jgi:glycerol kinase
MNGVLVIDVGTTNVRTAIVTNAGSVAAVHSRRNRPDTPFEGLVEFDAVALWQLVLELCGATLGDWAAVSGSDHVDAVAVTNQRASTVVWDAASGVPVAPALGWQDLRTIGDCLGLVADGIAMAPNHSATKLAHLLLMHDGDRQRSRRGELRFGTVDTWLAWNLTGGASHVSEATNQIGTTGLVDLAGAWDHAVLNRLDIPVEVLPQLHDTVGQFGACTALPGAPPLVALVGDQSAALMGQGCVQPGDAKCTFGTGGMLDVIVGTPRPDLGPGRTYPIAAHRIGGNVTYAAEAIMLTAGTNVDWLVDDLGLVDSPAATHDVAAQCADTGGVVYVPALLGLGAPVVDYGARSGFFGLTRGTRRAEIVRAVLEGVAQRAADLVESIETDTGVVLDSLRINGGMTENPTFVQAVANAIGRPVSVSAEREATTLGAGLLGGIGAGWWGIDAAAAHARVSHIVEPNGSFDRDRWRMAVDRVTRWHPEISDLINFFPA